MDGPAQKDIENSSDLLLAPPVLRWCWCVQKQQHLSAPSVPSELPVLLQGTSLSEHTARCISSVVQTLGPKAPILNSAAFIHLKLFEGNVRKVPLTCTC